MADDKKPEPPPAVAQAPADPKAAAKADAAAKQPQGARPAAEEKESSFNVRGLPLAVAVSVVVHAAVLVAMAFIFLAPPAQPPEMLLVDSELEDIQEEEPIELEEVVDLEVAVSASPTAGGMSVSDAAATTASNPVQAQREAALVNKFNSDSLTRPLSAASGEVGLTYMPKGQKGSLSIGDGNTDAGALNQITKEILRLLSNGKLLVVWVFDASNSLEERREDIAQRFDRVYHELDVKVPDKKALLSAVLAVEDDVQFMLDKPTNDIPETVAAIRKINTLFKDDPDTEEVEGKGTGNENLFKAILAAEDRYRKYRTGGKYQIAVFMLTDEIGDDRNELGDAATERLKRANIPFYTIGPMATFSLDRIQERQDVTVKNDEGEDVTFPFWQDVWRGPYTRQTEIMRMPFDAGRYMAGFGSFHLSKLTRETGGIFFVHNDDRVRNTDYESNVLEQYKANYGSPADYAAEIGKNPFRSTIMRIATDGNRMWGFNEPNRHYRMESAADDLKRNEREMARWLDFANKAIPAIEAMAEQYPKETNLRWQGNYDLVAARLYLTKVRAMEYLWAANDFRTNPPPVRNAKSNAWRYDLVREINVGRKPGSRTDEDKPVAENTIRMSDDKQAKASEELLQKAFFHFDRIRDKHSGTPWELAAKAEKRDDVGVRFAEDYLPEWDEKNTDELREKARQKVKNL